MSLSHHKNDDWRSYLLLESFLLKSSLKDFIAQEEGLLVSETDAWMLHADRSLEAT